MDANQICRQTLKTLLTLGACLVSTVVASPAEEITSAVAKPASVRILPWQDDANLRDVQMIGERFGYAAGDHGMVWRTLDSGNTWQPCPVPADVSLHSLSFVTERIGWVAGMIYQPYTQQGEGRIFATLDGGQTWEQLETSPLPPLEYVRLFSPREAVVVGHPTAMAPSGIYRTQDGSVSWTPVPGEPNSHWTTAKFFNPQMGLVAGRDGALMLVGGGQLLASRLPPLPSRAIRGLSLQDDDTGWVVGDGALILTTSAGGVSWSGPATPLPEPTRTTFDFRAVASQGEHVWIAGSPGSVVWHSPDRGQTWRKQLTGQALPLTRLQFVDEHNGVAVGEMGVILQTNDGGTSWKVVRGGERRAAWMAIIDTPESLPSELTTHLTAEGGYRSVIWSASHAAGDGLNLKADSRDLMQAALALVRGNVAGISWQLPIDQPDLGSAEGELLRSWQNRAENRAPLLLVEELARQIRTYRPEVVFLPYASEDDAAALLIQQAGTAALRQAADATRALHHAELGHLSPWKVSRVFQQLAPGSTGDVRISTNDYLPRIGETLHQFARPAGSLLSPQANRPHELAYRRLGHDTATGPHVGGFFSGMESAPDSPIRRALSEIDEQSLAANQRKAQLQRNFRAISEQAHQDPQKAAQLIGQLPEVLRDLSADQAVVTLGDLAMNYRQQSQFQLAESTYLELVRRHPDHPAAADAMVWLITYWSSGEMAWQRSRERGQQVARPRIDTAALQNRIQQAGLPGGSLLSAPSSGEEIRPVAGTSDRRDVVRMTSPSPGSAPDSRVQWQRRALELVEQIGQSSPHLFQQPKVQLPLAALKRANNQPALADGIYRQFQGAEGGSVSEFLQRELWASQPLAVPPRQLAICKTTETRPFLDGILSDECWQEAAETPLAPPAIPGEEPLPSGLIMFAYDQQFLYIAAILKQVGERPVNTSEMGGRDYDASLTGYDRLSLALDPDRDYVSSYQLQVDERGQTADQCWEDRTWNPKWFVARQADAERWQIEAAIPWNELAPNAPFPREVWAMGAVRTIPYTAYHGWGNSTTWPPAWHSFGLLRFE